ncbi:MAG TPA: site-specific integrase [Gemmatimonadaceae bacterium]|nr:site-specific integrase [Gemmatimonadaceae bacterium]
MPFKKGGTWVIRVPQRYANAVRKGTGTRDRRTAVQMEVMVQQLRRDEAWDLLEAVTGAEPRPGVRATGTLHLRVLFDAWRAQRLGELRDQLSDLDIEPLIPSWRDAVRAKVGPHSDTPEQYEHHVRTLITAGERFPRSALTYARIVAWLAGLRVADPTRRKYRAALSSFADYLMRCGLLEANPVRDVKPPKAGAPRQRHIDHPAVLRLVEAQAEPFRTLSALIHGTGMEISAALRVRRADIDPLRRTVHAHGTKTAARDRIAYVEAWAWPYVERHIATLTPAAPLFPGITRWRASDMHRDACKRLGEGFEDYRLHDARHTYAVRAIKAGASLEHVAEQLGHADTQMVVKVYGRYRPSADERREWERIAAAQDVARAQSAG